MTSTSISEQTKENLISSLQMPEPTMEQSSKIQAFEWIDFPANYQEISYMSAFLKEKHAEDLDYLALDIEDFNLDQIKERNTSMNDIIKDQYLRILKYGNVSSFQSKQKKTPEKSQENIYDLDDSFIDDSDLDQGLIKMEVYQAQYADYLCNEGGVGAILRTEHYKNRLNDLESIRKFTMEDKKVYMKKQPREKQSKKNKKKTNITKEKKTPKKSREIVEISSEEDEKKPSLLHFENLRPEVKEEENKMEKNEEILKEEERKIASETTSTVETNSKGKKSVKAKEKPSAKKDESKRKRDSMVKKNEIFNANHPTLGKYKVSKTK